MKIIFLDIDGVLALEMNERDEYGALFNPDCVESLTNLIANTKAKIVISSSWRGSGLEVMQEMWKARALPGEVIGITPHLPSRFRGEEVAAWLKEHQEVEQYVILDDDRDFYPSQVLEHFVRCSPDKYQNAYGLTFHRSLRAAALLKSA